MGELIIGTEDNVIKMLSFDHRSNTLLLKIQGKFPAVYTVTTLADIDKALEKPRDVSHMDVLLDVRNYIRKAGFYDNPNTPGLSE